VKKRPSDVIALNVLFLTLFAVLFSVPLMLLVQGEGGRLPAFGYTFGMAVGYNARLFRPGYDESRLKPRERKHIVRSAMLYLLFPVAVALMAGLAEGWHAAWKGAVLGGLTLFGAWLFDTLERAYFRWRLSPARPDLDWETDREGIAPDDSETHRQ